MGTTSHDADLVQFDGQWFDGLEFCRAVYEKFDEIRERPGGKSLLRRRIGAAKQVVEELLPIAYFVQRTYRVGVYVDVRWHRRQPYDAELSWRGDTVTMCGMNPASYLEVTSAAHPSDYLLRERLGVVGSAFAVEGLRRNGSLVESTPIVRSGLTYVHAFAEIVLTEAKAKAGKDYPPGTTLIINCTPTTVFLPSDWDLLCDDVAKGFPVNEFRQVFICSGSGEWSRFLSTAGKQVATP